MASSLTLTTMRGRVSAFLMDAALAVWDSTTLDEAIRLALAEYSKAAPLDTMGTVTPAAGKREQSLAALAGLLSVTRVWFPYTAAAPEYPPAWCSWRLFWDGGTPALWLDVVTPPSGTDVVRLFYKKAHALSGLDGAGSTTFPANDDSLLVVGAAGYACLARSSDLNEQASSNTTATPNYAALGQLFLDQFRAGLAAAGFLTESRGANV